jgi:hypothetical protein
MMRHVIFADLVLTRPVAARARRMAEPAATARLVASSRSLQGMATRPGRTTGAVDMAPIAAATDDHLGPAIRVRAQKEPRLPPVIMATTAAPERRRLTAWTRAAVAAIMPLQSCLCTVWGTAPKQTLAGDERRCACLVIPAEPTAPPSQTATARSSARNAATDCPGRPQVPPAPSASLRGAGPSYGRPGQSGTLRRRPADRRNISEKLRIQAVVDTSLAVCPVQALRTWLDGSATRFGPVFRKIDRWGSIEHHRLGTDAIRRILARRALRRTRQPRTKSAA